MKEIFPQIYSTEEEAGAQVIIDGVADEPYLLVNDLEDFVPKSIKSVYGFYENGFRIYPGTIAVEGATNLELAMPECESIKEQGRYTRASEYLLNKIAENFVNEVSDLTETETTFRIQRRVVDSQGSRKACHDNFGFMRQIDQQTRGVLLSHLGTRSFISGAGYVTSRRLRFAQKVGGITSIDSYGYYGSMLRLSKSEGGLRYEVRCSDQNISDWSTRQRMGGVALAMAAGQAGLIEPLEFSNESDIIAKAKQANALSLSYDSTIKSSESLMKSIDYEQRIASLVLEKLPLQTDVPFEIFQIAEDRLAFCEDMKSVVSGESQIELLADRADWATKMVLIQKEIDKDRDFGIKRRMGDIVSKKRDMMFDNTTIVSRGGTVVSRKYGDGFKARTRGMTTNYYSEQEILKAAYNPPQNTRARLRSHFIKTGDLANCDWSTFTSTKGEVHVVDDPLMSGQSSHKERDILNNLFGSKE